MLLKVSTLLGFSNGGFPVTIKFLIEIYNQPAQSS